MISGVSGTVLRTGPNYLLLMVGPITLEVQVPTSRMEDWRDKRVHFFTHMRIVNDQPVLYGFPTHEGLNLFLRLTVIKGIGPKLGLALLSAMSDDALLQALSSGDSKALTAVPGVGAGTAQKIIRGFI